jgi:hypothetical protein
LERPPETKENESNGWLFRISGMADLPSRFPGNKKGCKKLNIFEINHSLQLLLFEVLLNKQLKIYA